MAKLIEVATRIQDLYEQNYTTNDRFFDIGDFKFWTATTYSAMLNALYQQERRQNKQIEGFSNIEIPAAWLLEETLEIKELEGQEKLVACTSQEVFSFDFDNSANALQGVHSFGKPHCNYRKISLNERRFRQIIPPVGVILFYLNNSKEIVFWGAKEGRKIRVQYVPKVLGERDDCLLSDNIISTLSDEVLKRMISAREGKPIIDKLDDQNPNGAPAQQVNQALGK